MAINGLMSNMPKIHQNGGSACHHWDVQSVLYNHRRGLQSYAVVVLNRPVAQAQTFLTNLWNSAAVRITVDGGTKKWDAFLNQLSENNRKEFKRPDLVTGDFDSISEEIYEKYKEKGCQMIHTPDQNHTDFTKSLMELNKYCLKHNIEPHHVIVLGQSSGRIDQVLGNIHTLYLVKEKALLSNTTQVYLMSDDSISWLLQPGKHVISIPDESLTHKRAWCSLLPIGEPCQNITTSGLKWNLSQQSLQFGGLVSTSNTFDGSNEVTVICSHTILWSMRLPFLLDQ